MSINIFPGCYLRPFPGYHKPLLGSTVISLLRINQTVLRAAVLRCCVVLLPVLVLVLFIVAGWMGTNDPDV